MATLCVDDYAALFRHLLERGILWVPNTRSEGAKRLIETTAEWSSTVAKGLD
jgi:hypothetical protein